ncbi:APC family permease [Clostridium fermenticellae]|uniref:APC family permease n=1 Tax=Clostridium fermenticellae TaxID=2068654 RepID=A0A386H5A0_9CLOT|nr:APC family permease [Clostridium fermenticellae]AYD40738.1 APC family permease [Clostridium fermenticellae]
MKIKLEKLIIGESLKTEQLKNQKFNVFWGLPIMSSDAISSVAYAGEEILIVLIPVLGVMAYKYMFYASMCIVALLFLLVFSYRQTIDSYPNGGGAYVVARDNLGTISGLIAGSALSIDYILTVAVSSCAGTAAITSAIPWLLSYKVAISIFLIVFITIGNLRGVSESSKIFGVPTYLFVISVVIMMITGITKAHLGVHIPEPIYAVPKATGSIGLFLFLRAFASGCTALTGVEAVSNGIPSFRKPSQKNAKVVLELLALIIFIMFGGIAYLATIYHTVPNADVTVVAQIAAQVFGHKSLMFYVIQTTTAVILIMAANTAFTGLPLLLALMAKDGFVPRQFSKRGKRLSFSNGIIVLAMLSSLLVLISKGDDHILLSMYAVGVFISFTLSQSGMFVKWVRERTIGWRHKALINGFGVIVTFFTVILLGVTKFMLGAWMIFLLIPMIVILMLKIKHHYMEVACELKLSVDQRPKNIDISMQKRYVIVPIDTLNKSFLKAFNYARTISDNIIVFHVSVDDDVTNRLLKKWDQYNLGVPIVVKKSPYRSILEPLVKFIESEEYSAGINDTITVVIPQFVVKKWWGNILHNQTALFIKTMLIRRRNIALVTIPYIIDK